MRMDVYKMSNKEICGVILEVAKKYDVSVEQIASGISGSCFVIIYAKSNDDVKFCQFLAEVNDRFLGTVDSNGNIIDTEENILAQGYDGAIVLGSTSIERYKRYMLGAAHAPIKVIYKGGVVCG